MWHCVVWYLMKLCMKLLPASSTVKMAAAGSSAMLVNSLVAYTIHILEDRNYYDPSTV